MRFLLKSRFGDFLMSAFVSWFDWKFKLTWKTARAPILDMRFLLKSRFLRFFNVSFYFQSFHNKMRGGKTAQHIWHTLSSQELPRGVFHVILNFQSSHDMMLKKNGKTKKGKKRDIWYGFVNVRFVSPPSCHSLCDEGGESEQTHTARPHKMRPKTVIRIQTAFLDGQSWYLFSNELFERDQWWAFMILIWIPMTVPGLIFWGTGSIFLRTISRMICDCV